MSILFTLTVKINSPFPGKDNNGPYCPIDEMSPSFAQVLWLSIWLG